MTREGEYADQALHFSTDSVPARDRLPYFREAFGRSTARVEAGARRGLPIGMVGLVVLVRRPRRDFGADKRRYLSSDAAAAHRRQ